MGAQLFQYLRKHRCRQPFQPVLPRERSRTRFNARAGFCGYRRRDHGRRFRRVLARYFAQVLPQTPPGRVGVRCRQPEVSYYAPEARRVHSRYRKIFAAFSNNSSKLSPECKNPDATVESALECQTRNRSRKSGSPQIAKTQRNLRGPELKRVKREALRTPSNTDSAPLPSPSCASKTSTKSKNSKPTPSPATNRSTLRNSWPSNASPWPSSRSSA